MSATFGAEVNVRFDPAAPVLLIPKGAIFVKPPKKVVGPPRKAVSRPDRPAEKKILRLEVGGPKYGNGNGHHGSGV